MDRRALGAAGMAAAITLTAGCADRMASFQVADAAQEAQAQTSAPAPQPGTDARIQRWFLSIDKARITFDNVLLRAKNDIAGGTNTTNCAALVTVTARLLNALPSVSAVSNGGPGIAATYRVPLQQFAAVAQSCVDGDFAAARAALGDASTGAIAAYGAAQEAVDEILDAGA